MVKGGAAEGATRSNTEARGIGTNLGQAKNKTKAKYQTGLSHLLPKAVIGTNYSQAKNETKAKYQTALCLLQPKAGIGNKYGQAENKTEAKYQTKYQTILVAKMPLPANTMEAVVDFLYKDDGGAVIKSEDREFVENGTPHRSSSTSSR